MDAAGGTRPEAGAEAEVIPIDRRVPLRTRVEQGDTGTLVVRPAPRDLDGRDVVRDGDHVRVLWRDIHSGWELPAQVSAVERGTVLRWHLAVLGPAERIQRREAVRARLAVLVTAVLNSVDLGGEVVDLRTC